MEAACGFDTTVCGADENIALSVLRNDERHFSAAERNAENQSCMPKNRYRISDFEERVAAVGLAACVVNSAWADRRSERDYESDSSHRHPT